MPPRSLRDQHPEEVQRLADLLKNLQKTSGMSQRKLYAKLNISRSGMSRYLNGVEVLPEVSLDPFLDLTQASRADRQLAKELMGVITGAIKPQLVPMPVATPDTVPGLAAGVFEPMTHPAAENASTTAPSASSSTASSGTTLAQPRSSTAEPAQPWEAVGHPPAHDEGGTITDDQTGSQVRDDTTMPTADDESDAGGETMPKPAQANPAMSSLYRPGPSDAPGTSEGDRDGREPNGKKSNDREPGSVDPTTENNGHPSAEATSNSTAQVINNLTVVVREPPSAPPPKSSLRQNIWQWLTQWLTWWAVAGGVLVVTVAVTFWPKSYSTPEAASGSATSSTNTVSDVIPTSTVPPASTSTNLPATTAPPAPAPSSAPTESTSLDTGIAAPPSVAVPLPPTYADTDPAPAAAVPGGHCKTVSGNDIRVFKDPDNNEQPWTTWPKGTKFLIEPGKGTTDRYRTVLRNGAYGWVAKNDDYITDGTNCP